MQNFVHSSTEDVLKNSLTSKGGAVDDDDEDDTTFDLAVDSSFVVVCRDDIVKHGPRRYRESSVATI
jgi:hypothetical protein